MLLMLRRSIRGPATGPSLPLGLRCSTDDAHRYQEAVSAAASTAPGAFTNGDARWTTYQLEVQPSGRRDPHISWGQNGHPVRCLCCVFTQAQSGQTWTVREAALGPNEDMQIGQRLISVEPHYLVLNVRLLLLP